MTISLTGEDGSALAPLRADVRLELGADGAGALVDGVFGRRIKLDPRGVAIASALAGPEGALEAESIAASIGAEVEVVRSFAGRLAGLDLCETPRAAVRVAERRALAAVKAKPAA